MLQAISKGAEDESYITWHFNIILDRALIEELLERSVVEKNSSYLLRYFKYIPMTKVVNESGGAYRM